MILITNKCLEKDKFKLELQTLETIKLFGSTKKLIDKTKNGEVVEVVLVQCNLVDDHYQQKPELLCTFMPNKYYIYLLNIEPNDLVFQCDLVKTYNIEFDKIIITFLDQNGRPLEIEDKVNLTLVIIKQKYDDILDPSEEIIIPLENEILNKLRKVL